MAFVNLMLLFIHLYFCKRKMKTIFTPFGIYGIIWFVLLFIAELNIFKNTNISFLAYLFFYLAYIFFLIPNLFVSKNDICNKINKINSNINFKKLEKISLILFILFLFFSILYFYFFTKKYGSFSFILSNAYAVRQESIADSAIPKFISYGSTIGYASAGISAYLLFFRKNSFLKKIIYIMPFVLTFFLGLLQSGRMGIIFYALIYIGTFLLKINLVNKKTRKKYYKNMVFILLIFLVLLLIPKLIRDKSVGFDSYDSNVYKNYVSNMSVLSIPFSSIGLHFFTYVLGPLFAFGKYLTGASQQLTYGQAQFLPIAHLYGSLFHHEVDYTLLYDFVEVPFQTNIFTYLREAYSDFGFIGIIITPLTLGVLCLISFKFIKKNEFLTICLVQFLFIFVFYSIFYNPFSQGGPALGFAIYILIALFFVKNKNNKGLRRM